MFRTYFSVFGGYCLLKVDLSISSSKVGGRGYLLLESEEMCMNIMMKAKLSTSCMCCVCMSACAAGFSSS